MKYLMILVIACAGCTSVPVKQKFPDVPKELLKQCPYQLEKLENETKLSDVAKTVTRNYTTYHECAYKHDAWIEWYQIQRKIFEEANK